MRFPDIIEDIAHREARAGRLRKLDLEEEEEACRAEEGKRCSLLHIDTSSSAAAEDYASFPPDERRERDALVVVRRFMGDMVLPYMEPAARHAVRGAYLIALNDDFSDDGTPTNTNTLMFSRRRHRQQQQRRKGNDVGGGVLFPDPSQMTDHGGLLQVCRATEEARSPPWPRKNRAMFFAGTAKGRPEPERNARIAACVWALDHRDVADFWITGLDDRVMDRADALRRVPRLQDCLRDGITTTSSSPPQAPSRAGPFPPLQHTMHRFAANVPGATRSHARVPSILASRTVLIDDPHQRDVAWYSSLLQEGVHYVGADMATRRTERGDPTWASMSTNPKSTVDAFKDLENYELLRKHRALVEDEARCAAIADAANSVAYNCLLAPHAALYARSLLEEAAYLTAP